MNSDMRLDLHIHTEASDGTWTPQELIGHIIAEGIGVFSLTDHDTTENCQKTAQLAKDYKSHSPLHYFPGVEINATLNKHNLHILGYGIDIVNKDLQALLEQNRILNEQKDRERILYLIDRGIHVSLDEYDKYKKQAGCPGCKSLAYLMKKGIFKDTGDYVKLFKRPDGSFFSNTVYPPPEKVIAAIKAASGVPVLAHPGKSYYGRDPVGTCKQLLEAGIEGVECFHPSNNEGVTKELLEFCKTNNLIITGGSDCHGGIVNEDSLNSICIFLKQVRLGSLLAAYPIHQNY